MAPLVSTRTPTPYTSNIKTLASLSGTASTWGLSRTTVRCLLILLVLDELLPNTVSHLFSNDVGAFLTVAHQCHSNLCGLDEDGLVVVEPVGRNDLLLHERVTLGDIPILAVWVVAGDDEGSGRILVLGRHALHSLYKRRGTQCGHSHSTIKQRMFITIKIVWPAASPQPQMSSWWWSADGDKIRATTRWQQGGARNGNATLQHERRRATDVWETHRHPHQDWRSLRDTATG